MLPGHRSWSGFYGLRSLASSLQYTLVLLLSGCAHFEEFSLGTSGFFWKRLNKDWSDNVGVGISEVQFLRILITVTMVKVVYLHLSIVGVVKELSYPRHLYSLGDIYGSHCEIIVSNV
jgi:hypothetical protein